MRDFFCGKKMLFLIYIHTMKRLVINKKNLFFNLKKIKSTTSAKICAVVKANAYGHGAKQICTLLQNKVDFFGVATLEEGLFIRTIDTQTPILIMGNCQNYEQAAKNNISVCIHNTQEFSKAKKCKHTLRVHLKINTGMNRLGFNTQQEFEKVLKSVLQQKNMILEGVYTHFATMQNDLQYFDYQQKQFEKYLAHVPSGVIVHGGGSFLTLHKHNYDMVRTGIFLFGYGPGYKPVMRIESKIVHTNFVPKGQNIGYSKAFVANKDMHVGIIPIGYNDGIPRNFIGQNVFCGKTPLRILSVCMDMTIIELAPKTTKNSLITVFCNANQWANFLGTNLHDVLVKFGQFRGQIVVV